MLTGKRVLVTGATGFIGGRLVEKLILYHHASVQTLVRRFSAAVRIARFDLQMIKGDIADACAVEEAVAGCDVVFHCAHDFPNPDRNLDGIRVLAEACLNGGVKRLVHVSSISVYEPLADGDLDESSPAEPCGWAYQDNKLAVEQLLIKYREERNLPVVIVQPSIVYGPFSGAWTVGPVKQLRRARLVLPEDSDGLCNAVYVDDVVDALILAAQKDEALGERFLISGPAPVSWREFYAAYERMTQTESVVLMPIAEIERSIERALSANLRLLKKDPQRLMKWRPVSALYSLARNLLSDKLKDKAKKALPFPLSLPDAQRLSLLRARTVVKIDKARRLLGYQPAFDFERGMQLTAEFVAWANI